MSTPTEQKQKMAEECCKLANQRFGLMMSLKKAMIKLGCTHDEAVKAVEHAKSREALEFNRILDKC
jgi:hypothetical protein